MLGIFKELVRLKQAIARCCVVAETGAAMGEAVLRGEDPADVLGSNLDVQGEPVRLAAPETQTNGRGRRTTRKPRQTTASK